MGLSQKNTGELNGVENNKDGSINKARKTNKSGSLFVSRLILR